MIIGVIYVSITAATSRSGIICVAKRKSSIRERSPKLSFSWRIEFRIMVLARVSPKEKDRNIAGISKIPWGITDAMNFNNPICAGKIWAAQPSSAKFRTVIAMLKAPKRYPPRKIKAAAVKRARPR